MQRSFDPVAFAEYVPQRWRFIGSVCGLAVVSTLVISLALPKRYTAKASLLIDDPPGNDVRATTAISPVYLESLRSYEHFAASDSLFRTALDRFKLRASTDTSIESLKRRVLKVSKLRDTRILEISATLPNPKTAQALVQFLAEETVKLNQSLAQAAAREVASEAERQQTAAKQELQRLQAGWSETNIRNPIETAKADVAALTEMKTRIGQEMLRAQVDIVDTEQRQSQSTDWKTELAAARARMAALEKQSERVNRELEEKMRTFAKLSLQRQALEIQLKTAQAAFDAASLRVREVQSAWNFRGERLRIIDPGIVPERPAFPNIPLNLLIAGVMATLVSLIYLAFAFHNRPHMQPRLHAAAKHSNA